jgi:hypothetical protein
MKPLETGETTHNYAKCEQHAFLHSMEGECRIPVGNMEVKSIAFSAFP